MSAAPAGASRRSHTKSRNGCKTCKKRHIRCDETFPNCRNCQKHQVRCDYMDLVANESSQQQPPIPELYWTPEIDSILSHWQRNGYCTLGEYSIDLMSPTGHAYTKSDLHLIYHALWSGNNNMVNEFTIWTGKTPKFLQVATSQPFLVRAILGFGSLAVAWEKNSTDAKTLAYHHGSIALHGLQEAIASLSRENADAALAASILLSWQANDWRSWASLVSGIRTLTQSMQPLRNESKLADVLDEQEMAIPLEFPSYSRNRTPEEMRLTHANVLQRILDSLQLLLRHLGNSECVPFVEQLKDYVQRLYSIRAAHTPEEEFNLLYEFRKWLFWVPATLLRSETRDMMTLVVLAYYYATAISFEPAFPNVASAFCSTMALKPLEEIFRSFDRPQFQSQDFTGLHQLLDWPRQVAASYRHRKQGSQTHLHPASMQGFEDLSSDLASVYDLHRFGAHPSPGIGPSSSGYVSTEHSSHGSPFLDVSSLAESSSSSYGSYYQQPPMILPSMPADSHSSDPFGMMGQMDWRAGFVSPTALWT